MTRPSLVPTDALPPEALHAAFTRAFADYLIGPFNLALAQWPGFLLRQGIDLALSRAALHATTGEVLAFALVAPRPAIKRWRLGTMGAVPEARGSGAAVQLLQDFIQRGREAGLAAVELEVFAQNTRALRLYRRHGFVEQHALQGWQRPAEPGAAAGPTGHPAPTVVDAAEALAWLAAAEASLADLPLQVGPAVVGALTVPWVAWRRGSAQLVFSNDEAAGVIVRSLVDLDPVQADAQALVQALLAQHPGARLSVPPLQRPDVGGDALRRCGLGLDALHQFIMRRDLAGPLLRDESPADLAAIAAVHEAAFVNHPFSRHDEALIVQRLRVGGSLCLSLVAQDEASGAVIGHAAFSPVQIGGQPSRWVGLGPVAVRPGAQSRGVGSAVVAAGLARLRAAGVAGCVVLGDPAWYARFGFEPRPELILPGAPAGHFQAVRLAAGEAWPAGLVSYDAAFGG